MEMKEFQTKIAIGKALGYIRGTIFVVKANKDVLPETKERMEEVMKTIAEIEKLVFGIETKKQRKTRSDKGTHKKLEVKQ